MWWGINAWSGERQFERSENIRQFMISKDCTITPVDFRFFYHWSHHIWFPSIEGRIMFYNIIFDHNEYFLEAFCKPKHADRWSHNGKSYLHLFVLLSLKSIFLRKRHFSRFLKKIAYWNTFIEHYFDFKCQRI